MQRRQNSTAGNAHRWLLLAFTLVVAFIAFMWTHHRHTYRTAEDVFRETMDRIDANHDGRISREEWARYSDDSRLFQAYDFNGDGYLDVVEFTAMFSGTDPGYSQHRPRRP